MRWTFPSEYPFSLHSAFLTSLGVANFIVYRFAINDEMDWSTAEVQVQKLVQKDGKGKGGLSSIVSVKGAVPLASLKRKADAIREDGEKYPKDKKTRRGGKKVKH
jgi:ribosomal protein S15P/S13E